MIARSDSILQRIFPPIQPYLYRASSNLAELTPDQRAAQKIIALANRNFTRWERLVGWKLDSIGQIGRLLLQHRLAMEAELAAQWERADFFWNQVLIELKAFSRRHKVWQALASTISADEPEVVVMSDRLQLRQRLVDELLIDTHFAFYNGLIRQIEKLSLKDRAFVHIDYIQKLFDLSDIPENRLLSMLAQPWQQQLNLCKEAGQWQQAIEICTKRLKYFPRYVHYQNELTEIHFLATLAKIRTSIRQGEWLGIDSSILTSMCFYPGSNTKNKPHNKKKFNECIKEELIGEFMGILILLFISYTFLHTVLFSSIIIGTIFFIFIFFFLGLRLIFEDKKKADQSNYYAVNNLKNAVKTDSTGFVKIDSSPKARKLSNLLLGNRELKEAKRIQSGINCLKKLSKDYRYNLRIFELLAELHHVQSIKLVNGGYLAEALFLIEKALTYNPYLQNASETRNKLTAIMKDLQFQVRSFESKIARQPDVKLTKKEKHLKAQAEKGFTLVNAYLKSPEAQVTADAVKVAQSGGKEPIVTFHTPPNSPLLTPISTKRKPGADPFLTWLFSSQDIRLKSQAVVAIVLVVIAGTLTIQDLSALSVRNAAYQKILQAEQQQEILDIVKGAEEFFSKTPVVGKDGREQQVMQLYSEALVRWVAQQGEQLDAKTKVRIDRYQAVLNNSKQGGNQ